MIFCFLYVVTDYHSQFEDVGSPIADEVMEEQDDTERTGHTQYTKTVRGESSIGTTLSDISLLERSMYYRAPVVQTPIEHYINFDMTQPPNFSPSDASHVSTIHYFI